MKNYLFNTNIERNITLRFMPESGNMPVFNINVTTTGGHLELFEVLDNVLVANDNTYCHWRLDPMQAISLIRLCDTIIKTHAKVAKEPETDIEAQELEILNKVCLVASSVKELLKSSISAIDDIYDISDDCMMYAVGWTAIENLLIYHHTHDSIVRKFAKMVEDSLELAHNELFDINFHIPKPEGLVFE